MSLGLNSSNWEAAVTASPDTLQLESSAKSVHHVLSKAVTRGPQKDLAKLVCGPAFVATLRSQFGQKIIQTLVDFGTTRTVAAVCAELEKAEAATLVDADGVALIIRSVAIRVDDSSDARKALLKSVAKVGAEALIASKWSLNFAAEVAIADGDVFSKLVSSPKARSALKAILSSTQRPKEAIHFVETLLSKASDVQIEKAASFVMGAVADALKATSEHKPREEVLAALAQHADAKNVSTLSTTVSSWKSLATLVVKPEGGRIVAALLARADEKSGAALANAVLSSTNAKDLSASRSSSVLAVLTTLQKQYPDVCVKHNVKRATLSAAEVKLTKATKPAFTAAKDNILEKIRSLERQKEQRSVQAVVAEQPVAKKRRVA
jgi:hypothetical protein